MYWISKNDNVIILRVQCYFRQKLYRQSAKLGSAILVSCSNNKLNFKSNIVSAKELNEADGIWVYIPQANEDSDILDITIYSYPMPFDLNVPVIDEEFYSGPGETYYDSDDFFLIYPEFEFEAGTVYAFVVGVGAEGEDTVPTTVYYYAY